MITNGVVSPHFGFDRGFETFVYLKERHETDPRIHQGAEVLHRTALEWLDGRESEAPFFLYLHATDPHAPYHPSEPWASRFAPGVDRKLGSHDQVSELEWNPAAVTEELTEALRNLYDAEIAQLDHEFGLFLRELEARGVLDETLLVVVSDHGEEFGDHGRWQHGLTLNEEQLRVPLVDVRVYDRLRPRLQLFDLVADPEERHDLAPRHPLEAHFLATRLRRLDPLLRKERGGAAPIDEELEKALRAVGYLD